MRKSTFIAVLLLAITTSAFQCNKDKNRTSGCLKGELLHAFCASYIVKITDGTYDPSLAESSWLDPVTGNTYTNVFTVSNVCDLAGKVPGDEFSFYFTDDNGEQNCAVCLALRATPSKANKIRLANCGD